MAIPRFERVKTAETKYFASSFDIPHKEYSKDSILIPDITGDGIPDFITVEEHYSQGDIEKPTRDGKGTYWWFEEGISKTNFSYTLFLYPGIFDKNRNLVSSARPEVIDHNASIDNPSNTDIGMVILDLEVKDYNNDCLPDISFLLFTGAKRAQYQRVILFNDTQY